MATKTGNTGTYSSNDSSAWGAGPERSADIKQMLKNKSKEEIINWLTKGTPSEAE